MDAIGSENLLNAIPNALMPPEENTVRLMAKGLEIMVDLDDSGDAVFVAKATPAAPAVNLTNGHMSCTGLEQTSRETKYIQGNYDRRTGSTPTYIIPTNIKKNNFRVTQQPGT